MEQSKAGGGTTRIKFGQVLRNRRFSALWLARFISSLGDWLAILPLFSLIAFQRHGSAPETAMVMVSFIIPVILLGPLAGVFVDRWNLKSTLIVCDLICAVLAASLAFAGQLYQMYFLMAGISAVSCFVMPAQIATLPLILAENELLVANAISAQTLQLNQIFAPAIVGFALVWVGEKTCFYLDAASFLLSALLVSTIRIEPRDTRPSAKRTIWAGLKEGIKFIAAHPVARILVLTITIANGAVAIFEALFAVYVRDILGAGPKMFGSVTSALGLGTILGSFAVARFAQQMPRPRIINVGFVVQAVAVLTSGIIGMAADYAGSKYGAGHRRRLCVPQCTDICSGGSTARDVGACQQHCYFHFCNRAAWLISRQWFSRGLDGIAQSLLCRCACAARNRSRSPLFSSGKGTPRLDNNVSAGPFKDNETAQRKVIP